MAERPEDLNLPTPVVAKLINDCLPSNCKVSDEAKVAITKVIEKIYKTNPYIKVMRDYDKKIFC